MRNFSLAASFAASIMTMATAAAAQEVVLSSTDGSINLTGELVSYDDETYSIRSTLGLMSISRSDVSCDGEACPKVAFDSADLYIRGSDTVGEELMPLLVEGYFGKSRAAISKREELGDRTVNLVINDDFGSGEKLSTIAVQSAGSTTGFTALIDGQTDISMSSRPARGREIRELSGQGRGDLLSLGQEYIVAVDSIILVVSPENGVDELSVEQAAQIFSGQITNWADLGGPNVAINVYSRPDTSGTRGVFDGQILAPFDDELTAEAKIVGGNDEMADLVTADPGGIGYVGFAYARDAKPVDLIASCGIRMSATPFAAKTEEYILQRRLRLFTDNADLPEHAQALLDFAVSEDADGLVRKAGFIDLGVDLDDSGLDLEQLLQDAIAAEDPVALRLLRTMTGELDNASRLSTTFRFEVGSALLDNKAQRDVDRVVHFLARPENQGREALIVGFTDADGAFSANAALSEARAQVVLNTLQNHPEAEKLAGLDMTVSGYGELSPVGCNDTLRGRQSNRRVEVWLR